MLTNDLARYLRRCDFLVHELGPARVEVTPQRSIVSLAHLRIELEAFLRVWGAMNGGARAFLAEP